VFTSGCGRFGPERGYVAETELGCDVTTPDVYLDAGWRVPAQRYTADATRVIFNCSYRTRRMLLLLDVMINIVV
jgi:hypothetical protein